MPKVLLEMYLRKNLGDDLFLDIISKRYPNITFYVQPSDYYDKKFFQSNVIFTRNFFTRTINTLEKKIRITNSIITNRLKRKCGLYVTLGGSMFIEKKENNQFMLQRVINRFNKVNIPYYIIGANFGPYKSNEYYELYNNIFKHAKDVSFRDRYSYELFKNLKSVRVNPDIIFSLKVNKENIKTEKMVLISVIDCKNRFNNQIYTKYEELIVNMILKFDNMGYKSILMSFCKYEGDEDAIKNIMNRVRKMNLNNCVEQYNYNGNIDEALEIISKSEIVVGSRFHANVLGLTMNKTVIPIAYSDKTLNMLNDINFKGKVIDLRTEESIDIEKIKEEDLKYKINIDKYKKDAEKHFAVLDKELN